MYNVLRIQVYLRNINTDICTCLQRYVQYYRRLHVREL